MECWLDGKHVRLRGVGEIAADEDGNFYEVQGQQTQRLGELVMDDQGRVFEVRSSDEMQEAEPTKENSRGEHLERAAKSNGTDTSYQQTQANTTPPFQPQKKQPQSKARAQDTTKVQQQTKGARLQAQVNKSHPDQPHDEKSQPDLWPVNDRTGGRVNDPGRQSTISAGENPVPRCEIPQKSVLSHM